MPANSACAIRSFVCLSAKSGFRTRWRCPLPGARDRSLPSGRPKKRGGDAIRCADLGVGSEWGRVRRAVLRPKAVSSKPASCPFVRPVVQETLEALGLPIRVQRNIQAWFKPGSDALAAGRFPPFLIDRPGFARAALRLS